MKTARVWLALHLLRVAAAMLPVDHPAGQLARRATAIGGASIQSALSIRTPRP